MRDLLTAAPKWMLGAAAIVALGLLILFATGRRRGSRAYRWRMALWGFVIGLLGSTPSCVDPPGQPPDPGEPTESCYGFAPKDYDRSLVDKEGHLRVDWLKSRGAGAAYDAAESDGTSVEYDAVEEDVALDYGAPDGLAEGEDAGEPTNVTVK